ncbi:MAG TPA: hypothetical protein VH302_02645 [Bryobacteraceae bacterium]|nr:hypothetical protein [Bryobacteraceae bacterium]
MKAFPLSSFLTIVLSHALVMSPVWAQTPPASATSSTAVPEGLQIRVLNAETLQKSAQVGTKQSVDIQVTDSTGTAVESAAVTCRLPETGPTGTFVDGTHAAVGYTDAQGRATIDAVQWGTVAGSVAMRVTASKGTTHTGILLETTLQAAGAAPVKEAAANAPVPTPPATTVVTPPAPSPSPAAPIPVPIVATPAPVVATPSVSVTKPGNGGAPQPGQLGPSARAAETTTSANTPPAPAPSKLTPAVADPTVTVTKPSAVDTPHASHAKWYVLALVAVAAGAGAAFAMKGKSSSSSSTPTASISIGSPTVSVGGSH